MDDGYEQGMAIPIYYDPMIAKLATHDKDRISAIQKMKQAILDYKIEGYRPPCHFGTLFSIMKLFFQVILIRIS